MGPDPRWLEILKASGGQAAAIAAVCGVFLFLVHLGWLSPPYPWVVPLASFLFLLGASLAIASLGSAINKILPMRPWIVHSVNIRRAQREVENYIPHMTSIERKIIGYLLANNQKMLTTDEDGGHATTLISRGIIVLTVQRGQVTRASQTPMSIPDHIWDVLAKNKDKFPYTPPPHGQIEPHPWRVHYLER